MDRVNISKSETKAKPFDRIKIGGHSLPVIAIICKMVGCTNVIENIYIFIFFVCDANVELGRL